MPPRRNARIPRAHFDREHGIDAVFQPDRHEGIDIAIAVERDNIDAMLEQQIGNALVVWADLGGEDSRIDEWTVFKADVFPEMTEIEMRALLEHKTHTLVAQLTHRLYDLIEEAGIVHRQVAGIFQTECIANLAKEAATAQTVGKVALVGAQEVETTRVKAHKTLRCAHLCLGRALFAPLVAVFVVLFPRGAIFEQVVYFGGDRAGIFFLHHDGAVGVAHVASAVVKLGD